MISIIIPAYKEIYLQQTIDSILSAATKEIEIIIVLDGYWPETMIQDHSQVKILHFSERRGMRAAINAGIRISSGKYIMKLDGHCAVAPGFDVDLKAPCEHNWVVVPVRYALDAEKWTRKGNPKEFQYIEKGTLKGRDWPEFAERVKGLKIIDLMTAQGSCWFMHRNFFLSFGGLDDDNYGGMGREAQEVCLKTWLSGGRFILTRHTWYAHWNKPRKHVVKRKSDKIKSEEYAERHWREKIQPVVDRFAPVPTWI